MPDDRRSVRAGVRSFASASRGRFVLVAAACSSDSSDETRTHRRAAESCTPAETPVLNFAAYSTPREVYGKIIPAFQSKWKEQHDDQQVIFQESYARQHHAGAERRQRVRGRHRRALARAGRAGSSRTPGSSPTTGPTLPDGGMVSTSVVVLDVRPGNPLGLADFDDLAKPGVRDPDARPGLERRRAVEHRGRVGRRAARLSPGSPRATRPARRRSSQASSGTSSCCDKSARDSIQNFEAGQRRRGHHLRERGVDGARTPGFPTRRCTRRRPS